MKKNVTFLFLLFVAKTIFAQTYYSKSIDIDGYSEGGNSIHQVDAGFLITATSLCNNNQSECFSIINADEQGNVTNLVQYQNFPWWITSGAGLGNVGTVIKGTNDYYFSGSFQASNGIYDAFLMKTDELGDTIWMKTYGEFDVEEANRTIISSSDTSLLLLNAYVVNSFKYLVWLVNVDLDGNIIWEKYLGEDFKHAIYQDVIKLNNGDILVSYLTTEVDPPFSPFSMTVTKLDSQGNEKWTSRFASYDGALSGAHSCILELDNGGYLVNYKRHTFVGLDGEPPILIWLDSLGNVTQQYDFPNNFIYVIGDLIKTADGRIVGVGQVDLLDYDLGFGGWVFAFTQSGEPLWQRYIVDQHFLPEKLGWFSGVEELNDGRLAMTGTIDTPADVDVWLVVLDEQGCLEPGCTGEFQGYISGTEISVDTILKIKIYPNPVSDNTIYLDGLSQSGNYNNNLTIYIMDILGKVRQINTFDEKVEIEGLERGIYFLTIQNNKGQNMWSGKFVKN